MGGGGGGRRSRRHRADEHIPPRLDSVLHGGAEVAYVRPGWLTEVRDAVEVDRWAGRAFCAVVSGAAAAVGEAERHVIDDDAELDVRPLRIGPDVRQVGKHQDRALRGEVPAHGHGVAWQLGPRGAVALPELVPS